MIKTYVRKVVHNSSGMFSTDCAVALFGRVEEAPDQLISDLADVKFASGINGPEVICKK